MQIVSLTIVHQQAIPEELSEEREKVWKSWVSQYRAALKKGLDEDKRKELQNSVNPVYIPRNHLLQEVISEAEAGNYKAVSASSLPMWLLLVLNKFRRPQLE